MFISCFVSPHYGGGIGRHTREMVRGLAARTDTHVELLVSGTDARKHPEFEKNFSGVRSRHLPLANRTLERLWKGLGWPPIDRFTSHATDVIYAPAHARLPTKKIPTVITIHDVQAIETGLPWSDTAAHAAFRRKWMVWLPKALSESARILTVSNFTKQRLVELAGVDPARIGVVGNGVSEIFFSAGSAPACERDDVVVVIGGIRTKKGAAETLAVARQLAAQGSSLRLEIVGTNDPEWDDAARALPNVRLLGVIDDHALAARLRTACALLFLSPYEGFGIPVIEAMAAGTPAVVADSASLPEVAAEAGIVVAASQTTQIADVLERIRGDRVYREDIVRRGVSHARLFTWDACVARLMNELTVAMST